MCVCEGKRWDGRGREDKMSLGGKEKTTYSYFQDIGKDDGCISVDSRETPEAVVETGKSSRKCLSSEKKMAASLGLLICWS